MLGFDTIQEVLEVYHKHGVKPRELYDALNETLQYANVLYWEECMVSVTMLYMLKDTVWFNLEHLAQGGQSTGLTTLVNLGSKFPQLARLGNDDVFVEKDDVDALLDELTQVERLWSQGWELVMLQLGTRDYLPEQGASVKVKFAKDQPNYYSILDLDEDVVTCLRYGLVGEFELGKLVYNALQALKRAAQLAQRHDKGIRLNVDAFE